MDFMKEINKVTMSDAAVITAFTHDFQADICKFLSEDVELQCL